MILELLGFVGHQNSILSFMFHRVKDPLVLLFVKSTHRFACQRNALPARAGDRSTCFYGAEIGIADVEPQCWSRAWKRVKEQQ
jgi:hypothetical protein